MMATNFKIVKHQSGDSLHLIPIGDFDGNSAYELLNALRENCRRISRVLIHTSSLKNVYPFGRNVFQCYLGVIKGNPGQILFTGENAERIAPEGSKTL